VPCLQSRSGVSFFERSSFIAVGVRQGLFVDCEAWPSYNSTYAIQNVRRGISSPLPLTGPWATQRRLPQS